MNTISGGAARDAKVLTWRAEILKAMAQPTRLALLEFLRKGEECVCRICPALGGNQPNISKHLALMKKAGVLDSRQEGTMTFYWIKDTRVFEILDLVDEMIRREARERLKVAG
ncbi:MAG: winged helix-turn-helix transcriptional regulator [Deltaproteobacteria bacterium]|nr:winged helix-turn-helix transcriptional regulator [Deltaproteobacteria bacterium]